MLTITVDHSAFQAYLEKLQRHLGDLTPVMSGIGMAMEARVSNRFETRTDPNGVAWHPWAQSTKESYPYAGTAASRSPPAKGRNKSGVGNGEVLDRYGDMLLSLAHKSDSNSVRIGFGQPYATFHEYGTKHMPQRGLLMGDPEKGEMSKPDEAAVLEVLYDFINKT